MAIGSYYDVYTVDKYQERVQNIASSISELKGGKFFSDAKNNLKVQIDNLKKKEKQIFKLLKVKDIDELNQRLQEYNNAVINLSGAGLNQAFVGVLTEKNKQEFEAFNEAVLYVINQDLLKNKTIEETGIEAVKNQILALLNSSLNKKGGKFTSSRGMTSIEFFPASFTEEQKRRWKELLVEKYAADGRPPQIQKYFDVTAQSSGNTIEATFTWFDITEQLTQSKAREILSPGEINEINRKIKDLILSKVNDKYLISLIIDYVLRENNLAFFVGKNEKDITGLLGEIQGLYYLAKFLGDDLQTALIWRGGTYTGEGSKKPHQDILLVKFGIQVKNTTRDALFGLGSVDFANANIGEMLRKTGISSSAANVFLNYYGTLNFNVEYHRDRRKTKGAQYLPGIRESDPKGKEFRSLRGALASLQNDIDALLSLFAASFMYLDVSKKVGKVDANSLFLLGGVAFQTASQILSDVLAELEENERRFKIRSSLKTDKNIISALNNGTRDKDYSEVVANDIKLTSSFRF